MTQQSLSPFSLKNTVAPFENVDGKLVNIDFSDDLKEIDSTWKENQEC